VTEPAASDAGVADLLEAYRATAERWNELRRDVGAANTVFVENHRLYKLLRATPAGREGMAALMDHTSIRVRGLAATHSLEFYPREALDVLEKNAAGDGLPAMTAKNALRSYRAGTLNLEW
jgi:hypothetical protein